MRFDYTDGNVQDRLGLEVKRCRIGEDVLFLVTGGREHIGATSTAYWSEGGVTVQSAHVPGHKEGPLADAFARNAASALRRTVTVIMGIHVDFATRDEIQVIQSEVDRMIKRAIDDSVLQSECAEHGN